MLLPAPVDTDEAGSVSADDESGVSLVYPLDDVAAPDDEPSTDPGPDDEGLVSFEPVVFEPVSDEPVSFDKDGFDKVGFEPVSLEAESVEADSSLEVPQSRSESEPARSLGYFAH
jgi:hypothetical protein